MYRELEQKKIKTTGPLTCFEKNKAKVKLKLKFLSPHLSIFWTGIKFSFYFFICLPIIVNLNAIFFPLTMIYYIGRIVNSLDKHGDEMFPLWALASVFTLSTGVFFWRSLLLFL